MERFFACIAPRSLLKICQICANFAPKWPFLAPKTPFLAYWTPFFAHFSPKMRGGRGDPFFGGDPPRGGSRGSGQSPPFQGAPEERTGGSKNPEDFLRKKNNFFFCPNVVGAPSHNWHSTGYFLYDSLSSQTGRMLVQNLFKILH